MSSGFLTLLRDTIMVMKKALKRKDINEIVAEPQRFRFDNLMKKKTILFVLIFIIGASFGAFITRFVMKGQVEAAYRQIRPIREKNSAYQYINPLLACSIPNSKEFFTNLPLESKIKNLIEEEKASGKIDSVSVYYRDLVYGRWVGIDENQKYDPASMLKVVIMMAFYKQAEQDPDILNKYISYTPDVDDEISAVPLQAPSSLKVGGRYTIEKLIEAMIIDSDNGAKNALLLNVDERSLSETYTDLGIENPDDIKGSYIISAKSYSLFFRILYNATYLNKELSEKALGVLARAKYQEGIIAGVPSSVLVAQKFGEHIESNDRAIVYELHNCGIVYKPEKPYLLCVMTKGEDLSLLTKVIQNISRTIYSSED